MKIAIIGGGITGVVTAILANKKGFNVSLYEASNALGGVLRDVNYKNDWFYNNTQYLNPNGICYETISNCINTDLYVFTHEYGSITEVDGIPYFFEDFAQPVFTSKPYLLDTDKLPDSISERLKMYRDESDFLIKLASRFGNLNELCLSNLKIMQLARVLYLNNLDEVKVKKEVNKVADELLGLPRSFLAPSVPKETAVLPKNGYNKLFNKLSEYLYNHGVNVYLNSPVTKVKAVKNKKIQVYCRKNKIDSDYVVWCTNPISLLYETMSYKLSSPMTKAYCAVGICDYIENINPIYIQVFSLETSVLRFFLYNDKLNTKITIEGLDEYRDNSEVVSKINSYLIKYFDTAIKSELYFEKQKRYVLLDCEDKKYITKFKEDFSNSNIISGSWDLFGRDQKVVEISNQLDNIL